MNEVHRFEIEGTWNGDSNGSGTFGAEGWSQPISIPAQFSGPGVGASPEDLLIGSVASCYSITLAFLAERRKIAITGIEIIASGEVIRQPGGTLKLTQIVLKPVVKAVEPDEAGKNLLADLVHKAEQYCLVSNAVRGNVSITVEPMFSWLKP